mmetsp:Transcript_51862/g.168599  ORF Transcript_51862/g.168599 Transcript_51862/m.168599 type:complete len:81 (-) Transcript_51862:1386-1628(-)
MQTTCAVPAKHGPKRLCDFHLRSVAVQVVRHLLRPCELKSKTASLLKDVLVQPAMAKTTKAEITLKQVLPSSSVAVLALE